MTEVTEENLRDHLYKCADIIRDRVDPPRYKTVILPLVFYKAIDDTFEDRYEEALDDIGDKDLAKDEAFHDFIIPDEYRFDQALEQTKNLDQFLNTVFNELEKENPEKLENIFRVDYVSEDSLDHDVLHRLLSHLNTKNISLERVKPDTLGEAYMDLVRDFAEEEGKSGGQFFTPQNIVHTMVEILNPEPNNSELKIYDPTVGSAGMLVEMAENYRERGGDPKKDLELKGQEINPGISPIARMNLFLHNLNGEIAREDVLANPEFIDEDGELEKFDYVLANPPFSADWDKETCKDDEYNRFNWGYARADRADYAFIQHMIASLNDKGKMACVIPHGVLFRKHESKFREPMLDNDLVEAVIGLPENLFQNNSIPSALLIVNKDKPEKRKDGVLFIHAADEEFYKELSNQNELTEDGIKEIVEKYRSWETEERVSRVVDIEEIRENDYNLNIALYVDTTEPEEDVDVLKQYKHLKQLQRERKNIEKRVHEDIKTLYK